MQQPEALGGVSLAGGVDHREPEPDGVFIPTENLNVASAAQHVLKSGDTFIVNDPLGDITGRDDGLFVNDTRVLSQLRLTFGGRAPSLLSGSVSSDNAAFTAHLTNRPLPLLGGNSTPEGVIHVERVRVLSGTVLNEAIELTNYGTSDAVVPLSISFASDFRDMFEVRGLKRDKHGTFEPARVENGEVLLNYIGLDDVERRVQIAFSPKPDHLLADRADYTVSLPAQACVSIYLSVSVQVKALTQAQAGAPSAGVQQPLHYLSGAHSSAADARALRIDLREMGFAHCVRGLRDACGGFVGLRDHLHRDGQIDRHARLGRQLDGVVRAIGEELVWFRRKGNLHIARHVVEADIAEQHFAVLDARRFDTTLFVAPEAAHFEHVAKVAGEGDGQRHDCIARAVVGEFDCFVEHGAREHAHAFDVDHAFRGAVAAERRQGAVGQVCRERGVVAADAA